MSNRDLTAVVRLSTGDELGETMRRLRIWLDTEKIQPAVFATKQMRPVIRSRSDLAALTTPIASGRALESLLTPFLSHKLGTRRAGTADGRATETRAGATCATSS
jgi:hypothetical protein